jgi:flagellar biosynthesis protein FlhA
LYIVLLTELVNKRTKALKNKIMAEDLTLEGQPQGIVSRFINLGKYTDIMFAVGVFSILMVMLFPINSTLLDFLLSVSITFSILILLNVLFIQRPLDFNSFPTILLIAAIFRLSLNIATTRIILSEGHNGTDAAGHVVEAFGVMVTGGNIVIGAIVFIIITVINFVVITKGSGRVAEVSARFSLDAMPGKQMAIDADLSAGLIDEATARKRRKDLQDESTFYGAMDGASKFVRGDAIAGIIITFVNFIGGIVIGVVQRDLDFSTATHTYTILTIGDGLVSQIPALIISTAAGLLVTKSGTIGSSEKAVLGQLGRFPRTMAVVSGITFALGLFPGLPTLPFWILSVLTGVGAYLIAKNPLLDADEKQFKEDQAKVDEQKKADEEALKPEKELEKALKIDVITLELGYGLLSLINYGKGQKLTDQVKALRTQIARELGFVLPSVRIQDNMQLPANDYVIKIKELESARGNVFPDKLLVMNPTGGRIDVPGLETKEPTFGLPAKWIEDGKREEASFKGYTVVHPPTVITTHLTEIVKENIAELLSYSETKKLLDGLDESHKKLVEDLIPTQISVAATQKVLQRLLAEGISIRDLPTILEAVAEVAKLSQSTMLITEHVRSRLARQISYSHVNDKSELLTVTLSPAFEQAFAEALIGHGEEKQLAMAPTKLQEFIQKTRATLENLAVKGQNPVLLVSPTIRPYVRAIVERFRPQTVVISQNEIWPKIKINSVGVIG